MEIKDNQKTLTHIKLNGTDVPIYNEIVKPKKVIRIDGVDFMIIKLNIMVQCDDILKAFGGKDER